MFEEVTFNIILSGNHLCQNYMNLQVKNAFDLYSSLVQERKRLTQNPIVLEEKQNNANWWKKSVDAFHEVVEDNVQFIAESRKDNLKYYGFKLRFKGLSPEPYFRFDSDGPAHRNKDPKIPLDKQLVTTPHFNCFDKNGRPIAYKSEILKDKGQVKAIIEDINFGVSHFCYESNTRLNDDDFPEIQYPVPRLGLDTDSEDPLASVTFQI